MSEPRPEDVADALHRGIAPSTLLHEDPPAPGETQPGLPGDAEPRGA